MSRVVAGERSANNARFLRRHVLELPIHQEVTASQVEYIADKVLAAPESFFPMAPDRKEAAAS